MSALSFEFPASLTEKYRPRQIGEFAGLEKPKRILAKFASNPSLTHFRFVGPSGTGKTSMGFALAETLQAELHHITSQTCNLETLQRTCYTCHLVPMSGKRMHMVLIDEADCMSDAAQKFLLSKLDGTDACPNTIWVLTCNSTERLEGRFLSRTMPIEFSSYGIQSDAVSLLNRVWTAESEAPAPNLARIVKEACGNVREALMVLDRELLMV